MILKISRGGKHGSWTFLENIERLTIYNDVRLTDNVYHVSNTISLSWELKSPLVFSGGLDPLRAMSGVCEDGRELNIVFDTPAYLLNDEGKTIERLN